MLRMISGLLLWMISGLLGMASGALSHLAPSQPATHARRPSGHWHPHSRAAAMLRRCACRECHLVRSTRAAAAKRTGAIEACQAKMDALCRRADDCIIRHGGPAASDGDAIEWSQVSKADGAKETSRSVVQEEVAAPEA